MTKFLYTQDYSDGRKLATLTDPDNATQ